MASKEQIESVKEYFEGNGSKEYNVDVGGRSFNYLVVPKILGPKELPNFAMQNFSEDGQNYLIGVSDNINHNYRPFVAFHEYVEFSEMDQKDPDRCVKSLEEELNFVPEQIKPEYLRFRKNFFEELINYSQMKEQPDQQKIQEFRKSLDRIEKYLL